VGDTEKDLKQIFDFAEKERAILFFDEADALLMDRNMAYHSWELSEVNTLLSLLDRQTVPVVLCTNFVQYMDSALHRRIQSRIEFPFPAAAERQEIWRRELERQGLQGTFDLQRLAEVPITGGLIRNAVQRAVRRRVVSGNDLTFTTEELVRLAEGERPKLGVALERRVTGFGGACAWSGPEKRREEEANWGGC
jgi:SpoVK/Ycf46/Vps4 family AAA+-type ATPase